MKVNLKCISKLVNAETCDYKSSTPYELGNGQSVEDLVGRAGIARERLGSLGSEPAPDRWRCSEPPPTSTEQD